MENTVCVRVRETGFVWNTIFILPATKPNGCDKHTHSKRSQRGRSDWKVRHTLCGWIVSLLVTTTHVHTHTHNSTFGHNGQNFDTFDSLAYLSEFLPPIVRFCEFVIVRTRNRDKLCSSENVCGRSESDYAEMCWPQHNRLRAGRRGVCGAKSAGASACCCCCG